MGAVEASVIKRQQGTSLGLSILPLLDVRQAGGFTWLRYAGRFPAKVWQVHMTYPACDPEVLLVEAERPQSAFLVAVLYKGGRMPACHSIGLLSENPAELLERLMEPRGSMSRMRTTC